MTVYSSFITMLLGFFIVFFYSFQFSGGMDDLCAVVW